MKPIYCRIGSKYLMADIIIKHFPEHLVYVEPFIGSGGVYWKKEPSNAEVINDLDKTLIRDYKLVQKAPLNLDNYPQNINSLTKMKAFIKIKHKTKPDKLTDAIIRRCGGFSGTYVEVPKYLYKSNNPFNKLQNIAEYRHRMKNTIIKNQDYKRVISDYDSSDTLFYLDPPYIDSSKGLYEEFDIDYEEMANILKNIQGKFILSINKTPYIMKVFKDFKIIKTPLKTRAHAKSVIGSKKRTELLIMKK